MKLPSLQLLAASFTHTLKRFPFVISSALAGTIISIAMVEGNYSDKANEILAKLLMISSLGVPMFFALHIFCERTQPKSMFRFVAFVTGLFVLVQFYFSMNNWNNNNGPVFYRFFFWCAGMHLLVAFSAFFIEEELNGFWQFNKQLFLRFLTAALYSGVLYCGLAGALLAIAELFNVNLHDKIYINLWLVIAGLFNTIFFLGGVTEPVGELNEETGYPKGLKIFTQFVLLPLVTIYLLILYAYTAKILVQMNLPKGWVANLILGFSVTGILSLLLVYPLREQEENKWIKTFSRFYYFSLVPLVILLFVAIGTRIAEYGVTVERYIVAMLGVWLAVITLYFIFSKKKNIILIPLTLCLFLFGSCFGPWGMFKVSERSQLKRLHTLLEKNGVLANNKIVKLSTEQAEKIKIKDINQINSVLDYLAKGHGIDGTKDWFTADCQKIIFTDSLSKDRESQVFEIKNCIGIYGVNSYRSEEKESEMNFNFYCRQFNAPDGMDITGYNKLFQINDGDYPSESKYIDSTKEGFAVLHNNVLKVYNKGSLSFSLAVDSVARKLKVQKSKPNNYNDAEPSEMTFEITNSNNEKVKLMFSNFSFKLTDTSVLVNSVNGYLLLKRE